MADFATWHALSLPPGQLKSRHVLVLHVKLIRTPRVFHRGVSDRSIPSQPPGSSRATARHVSASLGGRYLPPGSGIGFSAPDGQAGACSAVPVKAPRNPNPLSASMTKCCASTEYRMKQQLRFLSQPDLCVSILCCEHKPGREYRVKVAARDACGLQLTETHSRFVLECIPHMSSVQQRST